MSECFCVLIRAVDNKPVASFPPFLPHYEKKNSRVWFRDYIICTEASLVPSFPSLAERRSESGPSIFSHIGEDRIKRMVEKILRFMSTRSTPTKSTPTRSTSHKINSHEVNSLQINSQVVNERTIGVKRYTTSLKCPTYNLEINHALSHLQRIVHFKEMHHFKHNLVINQC